MIWLEIYYCGIAKNILFLDFWYTLSYCENQATQMTLSLESQRKRPLRCGELAVSLWSNKITPEWKEWDWTLLVEALLVQKEKKMKIQSKAGRSKC